MARIPTSAADLKCRVSTCIAIVNRAAPRVEYPALHLDQRHVAAVIDRALCPFLRPLGWHRAGCCTQPAHLHTPHPHPRRQSQAYCITRYANSTYPTAQYTAVSQLSLIQLGAAASTTTPRPLLLYIPGADGTGAAIAPHVQRLQSLGYDLRALHIPLDDRRDWHALTRDAAALLHRAVASGAPKALLLGESFGGVLALRLAAAAPDAIDRVVVINPATSFARSYGGIPSAIAATQLLGLFPAPLYDVWCTCCPYTVSLQSPTPYRRRRRCWFHSSLTASVLTIRVSRPSVT